MTTFDATHAGGPPLVCATCEIPISWKPVMIAGVAFGCAGGVVGGPCTYDYAAGASAVAAPRPPLAAAATAPAAAVVAAAPPAPVPDPAPATPAPVAPIIWAAAVGATVEAGLSSAPPPAASAPPTTDAITPVVLTAPATPAVEPLPPAPAPAPPETTVPLPADAAPLDTSATDPVLAASGLVGFRVVVTGLDGDDEAGTLTERLRAIAQPGTVRLIGLEADEASFQVEVPDRDAFLPFLPTIPNLRVVDAEGDGGLVRAEIERQAVAETINIVASRFDSFQRLNEFVNEMRTLPGVKDARMRRLVQGVLHLAVDYEAPVPLASRMRDLPSFRVRVGKTDADGLELFVTPVDDRVTQGR